MELVLFKDNLEDQADPQYGIVMDGEKPDIICLCCGATLEYGDYVILERLPWQDISTLIAQGKNGKYVVCMDEGYVRDAQLLNTSELSDEEFQKFDYTSCVNEHLWQDMEPNPFIAIIEAESEDEACKIAAEQKRYDKRCLYAIKI